MPVDVKVRFKAPHTLAAPMHTYRLPGEPSAGFALRPSSPLPAALVSGWLAPGREVVVQGFNLPHGMVYLGWPRGAERATNDFSYIDPRLPIASTAASTVDAKLVEYGQLSLEQRRAYLEWLASGRRDRTVSPLFVLRFLHGLQRRVVQETEHDESTADERALLLAELEGLLEAYGDCFTFLKPRLLALHEWVYLGFSPGAVTARYPWGASAAPDYAQGRTMHIRLALAKAAASGEPMLARQALIVARPEPRQWMHLVHSRASGEFASLFDRLYSQHFGTGIPLRQSDIPLTHRFAATAGANAGTEAVRQFDGLYEVRVPREPLKKVEELIVLSESLLTDFATQVRSDSSRRNSLEVLRLLPQPLWPEHVRNRLMEIRESPEATLMPLAELMRDFFELEADAKLSKAAAQRLCSVLTDLGVGFEPATLSTGKHKPEQLVALFGVRDVERADAQPLLDELRLMISMAHAVALCDGPINPEESEFIHARLVASPQLPLSTTERLRLFAHLGLLGVTAAALPALKKGLLASFDPPRRVTLARLAVHVAQADGMPCPQEVTFLEKLYTALGLDVKRLYTDLHQGGVGGSIRQQQANGELLLDLARVQALQEDTRAVDALLASVYDSEGVEDERVLATSAETTLAPSPAPSAVPAAALPSVELMGLKPKLAAFGRAVLAQAQWTAPELRRLADGHDVMVDGALDALNEAALDLYGAPLLEGDGPYDLNIEILPFLAA